LIADPDPGSSGKIDLWMFSPEQKKNNPVEKTKSCFDGSGSGF
jgi:hypothetical protein